MRKVSLISVLAVLALAGVFNRPAAFAQSKTCTLVLDISTMDENRRAIPVKNTRAFVVRKNTRRRIPATVVSGSAQFPRLRAGNYQLTVLKPGFKDTTEDVDFICNVMNGKTEFEVSLDPTVRVRVSPPQGIPPIRRGVMTVIGTEDREEENGAATKEPAIARRSGPITGGVLNGKAIELPKPPYPPIARQAHASGTVVVQVTIDEIGNVISAHAISGHPLLQAVCAQAARDAKFSPTKLDGQPVKVTGVITYNFVAR
jgi:TonB family protein